MCGGVPVHAAHFPPKQVRSRLQVPLEREVYEGPHLILAKKTWNKTGGERESPSASDKHKLLRLNPCITQFLLLSYFKPQELWVVGSAVWIHLHTIAFMYFLIKFSLCNKFPLELQFWLNPEPSKGYNSRQNNQLLGILIKNSQTSSVPSAALPCQPFVSV